MRKPPFRWVVRQATAWPPARPGIEDLFRKERTTPCLRKLFFLCLSFLLLAGHAAAQVRQVRRVLVLDDLDILSSPGFAEVDQAVFAGLQESPYQIELYHESLELTLFPDQVSQQRFRERFVQKYSGRRPDVIITAGAASLQFIADSREAFLSDIPVVFCAIEGELPDQVKAEKHFTGVLGRLRPEETLEVALRLLPGTQHVVVVGGVGKFDVPFEGVAREAFRSYESKLEFTYLTNLAMPALLEQLKHLPSHTVVYHTALTVDATGQRFIDSLQSVPLVASAANAPVFVMDDVDLRAGTVGGDLVNWAEDSRQAAEMAVRVLNGERPQDIPIVRSNDAYMFDWHALERWGIKESDLPAGSIVLFREPSVWERTRWFWISALLIIGGLSLLAAYLYHSRTELKLARDAQLHLSGLLINAQEKERSRLAAELHDDFSQRLALLVLGLENVRAKLSAAKPVGEEDLEQIEESASKLSSDLHTVSHRLHSSTLAHLGLVSGVRALCREFSSHQGVEIDFSSDGVPSDVDPDVSLCLFRIVQEALQNLKKHSGAARAQVDLRRADDQLFLTVSDQGKGFDPAQINHHGLGFGSMRGRVHLLGGQLEIRSEPGKGTRIEARVPVRSNS
jgi:signal transduction histidine kinase